jgi:hypothetical protein
MQGEKITMFCPLNLKKSEDLEQGDEWVMQGIASTSSKDSDGEFLDPKGADLSYFLKYGEVNFNHIKKNLDYIVGYPKTAMVNSMGAIEISFGLFKNKKLSKSIYEHAKDLQNANTTARLGLSIEGVIPKDGRDPENPNIIKSWRMTGVAVTPTPKNADTTCFVKKGESIEFLDESLNFFEEAVNEELLEKADQIEELVELNIQQEEPLSSSELLEIINNKNMKLKDILAKVKKGDTVELSSEDMDLLNKAQEEGLIVTKEEVSSEEAPIESEDRIIKSISELVKANGEALKSEISELKSELDTLSKSEGEKSEMIKSLSQDLASLKEKYETIDNTPVVKSTTEAIAKSEGEDLTKAEEVAEEVIEFDISTEAGINTFYQAVEALKADETISDTDARLAKIHVQQGVVSEAIEGILKAEGVVIKGMNI